MLRNLSQPEPPYKLPSYEILAHYGFQPEACIASIIPGGYPGKQGSTRGIQIYPGYKGSPPICIVLLAPDEYTLGPAGPVPRDTPIIKLRARTAAEFKAQLHAAGYPTKAQMRELDIADEARQYEQWVKDVAFIEMMNKGARIKKTIPKTPTLKYYNPIFGDVRP